MDKIEYIKLEIHIPKVTHQLIKNKMYLPVDEDIICKAVRNGIECKSVLDKIRDELHATAEMHEDGDYYLRKKWIDEILDKYKAESEK